MSSDRIDTNNKLYLFLFKTKSNSTHFDEWESYHTLQASFLKYICFLFIFYTVQITMQNKIQKAIAVSKYIKKPPNIKLDWTPHLKYKDNNSPNWAVSSG